MDYPPDQYHYPPQPPRQPVFYHPSQYAPYLQHPQQQFDEFYMPYAHPDYPEFVSHGPYHEDFEDVGEVATRPRLTKEQVGVLEAQFQANHKPNSTVKRQLAIQTNLSLPRVANWFQNRRAKAKQLKKQEEFENNQSLGLGEGPRPGGSSNEGSMLVKDDDDQVSDDEDFPPNRPATSDAEKNVKSSPNDAAQSAGWASLQRALHAAKAGHSVQQPSGESHMIHQMPSQEPDPSQTGSMPYVGMTTNMAMEMPHPQSFSRKHSWADAWASHQVFQDQSFDFGFGQPPSSTSCSAPVVADNIQSNVLHEQGMVSPDNWQDGLPTPRGTDHHQQMGMVHEFHPADFPLPVYPESRRGSAADSLTNNFDAFALANDSPNGVTTPTSAATTEQSEGPLDLAARRKRPRPAALTSASLRSRSYGAMTSMSPTFRPGMTPTTHTVRHVKSMGQNLNIRYPGIRKPSSAQRSPINFSTFAEAEAFDRLMAQKAAEHGAMPAAPDHSGSLLPPAHLVSSPAHNDHGSVPIAQRFELASRYQLPTTQHLTLMTGSPPVTPFTAEFEAPRAGFAMPPVSAPPQYATFPDYTPPYSAGPLTNSSWSDAPLTSPDLPTFPPVTYIPSFGHAQKSDSVSGHFSEFILASDSKSEVDTLSSTSDQKKADFFIQEFPNQKEEHANVARQLAQHKPKNYVFTNTAPSDYDQA